MSSSPAQAILDVETIDRISKVGRHSSESLYTIANEPSVGMHHVSDHIRRNIPKVVETRREMIKLSAQLDEATADADYSIEVLEGVNKLESFGNISKLLEYSMNSLAILYKESMNRSRSGTPQNMARPSSRGLINNDEVIRPPGGYFQFICVSRPLCMVSFSLTATTASSLEVWMNVSRSIYSLRLSSREPFVKESFRIRSNGWSTPGSKRKNQVDEESHGPSRTLTRTNSITQKKPKKFWMNRSKSAGCVELATCDDFFRKEMVKDEEDAKYTNVSSSDEVDSLTLPSEKNPVEYHVDLCSAPKPTSQFALENLQFLSLL
ncbi:hypothetical protein PROFUN_05397 [Planoprotostelium fungivorum]|uniref:Uncharacterized protein n=1 Tax=Planoprotostelium fungivorum TaxID=1890364 RepID=A0A2P6NQL3_9EUKA|nr:hypothetical protein PROFUN_05397 [Planoprotostelium fungivorum]